MKNGAWIAAVLMLVLMAALPAIGTAQKKKSAGKAGQPAEGAPAGKPEPAAAPQEPPRDLPAEKDAQRESWRLAVEPYAILGSGRPGKTASDFDKPDGVAFTPEGVLLATDAKNRRLQMWDVRTKSYLGEFGHGIFGGEIVDIAVSPGGMVYVTDQTLNLAYAFSGRAGTAGKAAYQFRGTRFGEQGFDKLGGIAVDSKERIYAVDAHLNEVRRFTSDGKPDPAWKFQKGPAGSTGTYLHGCEGIAIDHETGTLLVSSEKDSIIQSFDLETGVYKGKLIGAKSDGSGVPSGKSVFSGSVEGLALFGGYLLAVDESVGHIQIFELSRPGAFNNDLDAYARTLRARNGGYLGFFGHSPQVNFEDKNNVALQKQLKDGVIIPGQANPPGYFCSPDSIAAFTDKDSGETYIAIADQCNYRLAVYRWSDIRAAIGATAAASPKAEQPKAGAAGGGTKPGKKKKKK